MPLIIKSQLQQTKTQEQPIVAPVPTPAPVVKPKMQESLRSSPVAETNDLSNIPPDEHVLVVNGKQKKISKKSSYLLDMLVIDDE